MSPDNSDVLGVNEASIVLYYIIFLLKDGIDN